MPKAKPLADRIRSEVRTRGITGYRLYRMTGITQTSLGRFLRADGDLSLTSADKVLAALGAVVTFPAPTTSKGKKG